MRGSLLPTCRAAVELCGLGVSAIVLHGVVGGRGGSGRQGGTFEARWDRHRSRWLSRSRTKDVMDKGTGMSDKISITNDRGLLTEEQIATMFLPEQFAAEDKKVKVRVDAKRSFVGLHALRGRGLVKGFSVKLDADEMKLGDRAVC